MENNFDDSIILIKYFLSICALLGTAVYNLDSPWKTIYIGIFILALITINQAFIYTAENHLNFSLILTSLGALAAFYGSSANYNNIFCLYYFILLYDVILKHNTFTSIIFTSFFFLLDTISFSFFSIPDVSNSLLKHVIYDLFIFVIVFTIARLLRQIIILNNELSISRNNYSTKNIELSNMNNMLKIANEKNEEMAILRERNNIAREIHDILGHTLTIALVEIEAAKANLDGNPEIAREKLEVSGKEIRKGLNEVRSSVRTLKNNDKIDYYGEIHNLIENVTINNDIIIRYDIDDVKKESEEILRASYRCLQEGLTNGVRHGGATAFLFKLKFSNSYLNFSLEDNGRGSDKIQKGFGLTSMEERVKEANGTISFESEPGEGFSIKINFIR